MRRLIVLWLATGCVAAGEPPVESDEASVTALARARIDGLKREVGFDDAGWLEVTAGFVLVNEAAAKQRRFALEEPLPLREARGERVLLIARTDAVGRLVVASEAKYDLVNHEVVLQGGELRHGQAYLVVEPKVGMAVEFVAGTAILKRASEEPVPTALVASPATPFVAWTDTSGRFDLPLPKGRAVVVTASKLDVGLKLHAPGAMMTASAVVDVPPPASDDPAASPVAASADAAVLVFDMPYAPLPGALRPPLPLTLTDDERTETPAAGMPPAREPGEGAMIIQWDDNERHSVMHRDLGCAGFDQTSRELPLLFDARRFDDQATKGWRARGGVRITGALAADLVGDPQALGERHPDMTMGYCLLVTGPAAATRASANGKEAPWFLPGPAGSADLWQRVTIPVSARSVQARIRVLTQDPEGKAGITLRLEEAVTPLIAAPVSTLPLEAASVSVGDVENFSWQTPPRIVCRDLVENERGRTLTFRASVFEGKAAASATALVLDTVAFSRLPCSADAGRITDEALLPR